MENQHVRPESGGEVRDGDINLWSANAGLADDRVIWEMLRLTTGSSTPQKGIIPYGKSGWQKESGLTSTALVQGNVANGKVRVMPFRAIVGSTNTSNQTEKLRGQRSGYAIGASTQYTDVALDAGDVTNPRIDLVYAQVEPDADGDVANYLWKDPSDPAAIPVVHSATITKKTTVTISKVTGVAGSTPAIPATPSDGAGLYIIPLCYVWVPAGFNASMAVGRGAITEVAPCLPIHSSMGVSACMPANQQWVEGGTVSASQTVGTDRSKQNGAYLPSTMQGKEERLIMLQLGLSPVSHADGDVVDTSIDWRFRYFRWTVHYKSGTSGATAFASDRHTTPSTPCMGVGTTTTASGCGQSFLDDHLALGYTVADGAGTPFLHDLGSGTDNVIFYVRNTDGALVFKITGALTFQVFVWLEASAPYSNFGTV